MHRKPMFIALFAMGSLTVFAAWRNPLLPDSDVKPASSNKGSIVAGNTYSNPALGLQITLPGKWHFMSSVPRPAASERVECQGPLCGNPELEVALEPDSDPTQKLFLIAYKLPAEYLNRRRYPLEKFAKVMMLRSLEDNWVPMGSLDPVQLGGRPAYRLLVRDPKISTKRGFGYVSESNGYVFLLVGGDGSHLQNLRPAVENMSSTSPST